MKNSFIFLMLLFISIMAITSCGKKGCTNKYATNYCWKCKDDDGTCNYKSTMIFWFNKTTSDNLIADGFGYNGYYDIDVIVDYQYVGALNAGNYDTRASQTAIQITSALQKNLVVQALKVFH